MSRNPESQCADKVALWPCRLGLDCHSSIRKPSALPDAGLPASHCFSDDNGARPQISQLSGPSAHTPRDRDTGACKLAPRLVHTGDRRYSGPRLRSPPLLHRLSPPPSIQGTHSPPCRHPTCPVPGPQGPTPHITAGPGEGCVGSKLDGQAVFFLSLAKCRGCWEGSQSQTDLPCSMHTLRLLEEGAQRKRCRPQVSI